MSLENSFHLGVDVHFLIIILILQLHLDVAFELVVFGK